MFKPPSRSLVGSFLIALAVWLIVRKSDSQIARRRMRGVQPPVDELAGELQNAWADHHTKM